MKIKKKDFKKYSLKYHKNPLPGKICVKSTKIVNNHFNLSLAYSPGVAFPCEEIVINPQNVFKYTSKGNLVGVISNGSAVLGLGNIGALASKPVMEGKSILFKKFAGINSFDIEINENNPDKLCDIITSLEPTFGAINLEDIKSPECFYIEKKLRKDMKIPVFHDDQHGTAIVVAAALLNGLKIVNKNIKNVKLVVSGAGAASLACLDLIIDLGFPIENIFVTDLTGVIYKGRSDLKNTEKFRFAKKTKARTLLEIIKGADIFLGLSVGGILTKEMVQIMSKNPLIFALANPIPEIFPEDVKLIRNDAIIATGRSDYPNQVNNALCFPYIFRGALDSCATTITRKMEIAAVYAIAELVHSNEYNENLFKIYGKIPEFSSEYFIPKAFDTRLLFKVAPAVAIAANKSGVAKKPILNIDNYIKKIYKIIYNN